MAILVGDSLRLPRKNQRPHSAQSAARVPRKPAALSHTTVPEARASPAGGRVDGGGADPWIRRDGEAVAGLAQRPDPPLRAAGRVCRSGVASAGSVQGPCRWCRVQGELPASVFVSCLAYLDLDFRHVRASVLVFRC